MKQTLCIDIGGTRIKSAVIPELPDLETAMRTQTFVIRTLGWLNRSLPEILDKRNWASVASYFDRNNISYDFASICVPGPVSEVGVFDRADLTKPEIGVPSLLEAEMIKVSGMPVRLIKDADAWMMGFIRYMDIIKETIEYPVALWAFGTGVGFSVATSPSSVHSIELGRLGIDWQGLREKSKHPLSEPWHVHHVLGAHFFRYVDDHHKAWNYQKIREEFTQRVIGMCVDCLPGIVRRFGNIRTIVVAGGNAEYISIRSLKEFHKGFVFDLTDRHAKLSPDLIALLGVESATRQPRPNPWQQLC